MTILDEYHNGNVTPEQAAYALISDIREIESSIAPLQAEKDAKRDALSLIVAQHGTITAGNTVARITAPSMSKAYDKDKCEKLKDWLLENGHQDIAAMLQACAKDVARSGSLRLEVKK